MKFTIVYLFLAVFAAVSTAQPLTYVDAAADFIITTDQGTPAVLDAGDVVSWQPVSGAAVTGLVFGTNAFTSVQAAVDAVDEGGTVRVAAGLYDEGAEIFITKVLTLEGEGQQRTTLRGGGDGDLSTVDPLAHRVLSITSLFFETVTVRDLSIVDGEANDGVGGDTNANHGGGIFAPFARLHLERCTVSGNVAAGYGGGLICPGLIVDCTIDGNIAGLRGGGLYCSYWRLLVRRSTFSHNSSGFYGGGIFLDQQCEASVCNSTVSGNSAGVRGGGISFHCFTPELTRLEGDPFEEFGPIWRFGNVSFTTITGNTAGESAGGLYFPQEPSDQIGPIRSLIVGNDAPIDPEGTNLPWVHSSVPVQSVTGLGQAGVDSVAEVIEPLADNGGYTLTHKLVPGSRAIDYLGHRDWRFLGVADHAPDQSGNPRLFGLAVDTVTLLSTPDFGSVEYNEIGIYSTPAEGTTIETLDSPILIHFTDPVTFSNLSQVVLKRNSTGGVVPCSVTGSTDMDLRNGATSTITLTPSAPLSSGESYRVEFNGLVATYDATGQTFGPEASPVLTFWVSPTPLLDWRILHGLDTAGADDFENPSGDGISNLLKYAFNLAPSAGDLQTSNPSVLIPDGVAGLPLIETIEGPQLSITYVRRKTSSFPGISYQPYTGDDLFGLAPLNQTPSSVTSIDENWERVTIVDPATSESRFGRIEVTE